jgi:hypothetical protein
MKVAADFLYLDVRQHRDLPMRPYTSDYLEVRECESSSSFVLEVFGAISNKESSGPSSNQGAVV